MTDASCRVVARSLFALFTLGLAPGALPAPPRQLVLTQALDAAELRAIVRGLEDHGASIHHLFPPDAALGEVPEALDPEAIPGLAGRVLVIREGEAWVLRDPFRSGFSRLEGIWREVLIERPGGIGSALAGDALLGLAPGPESAAALQAGCPNGGGTSQYLLGDVVLGIVFPESTSSNPGENTEDWTVARQDQVVAEIVQGADGLAAAYPEAGLDFVYEIARSVPTTVEPITHSSGERHLWIGDAMIHLGHASVSDYIRDLRERHGTDWTVAAFVVDSLNDSDGMFPDGKFAFAYLGGPYQVMTYDNDGWGIGRMDSVFAHEFGHNFLALDEYASAGQPCNRRSGVLQVENQNSDIGGCLSDVRCLMRADTFPTAYCPFTEGQVGLRDTDADGIPDLRDAPPQSLLDPLVPDPSPSSSVTLAGNATARPDPSESPWPASHTLNELRQVDYRLDGGPWLPADPVDGSFDQTCEDFRIALSGLAEGWHEVESRAVAWGCDPADVDICDPVLTIAEATYPRERFYVNTDCVEDALEPNDGPGEEWAIAAGRTGGLRLCAFDPDRFRVYLRAGASLDVAAEYAATAALVSLDLVSPSGSLLQHADGSAGVAAVSLPAAAETGWHVLVFAGRDDAETDYDLVVIASCIDDRLEPSPDAASGPELRAGATPDLQVCPGDEDWYRVSVSTGADLTVRLSHGSVLGNLDLGLYRMDLTPIATSETGGNVETVIGSALPGGIYAVRAWGRSATDENRYQLDLATNRCLDDLGENDDDAASARPGPGRFLGHICPGDEDWVSLTVPRPSLLRATLVFNPGSGEIELDLLDQAQVVVARAAGGSGLRSLTLSPLRAGAYSLRLRTPAAADTAYTLDVVVEDPLTLHGVKRGADVVLDWNDVGVECFRLRRSDRKDTYDGGFETIVDLDTAPGEVGYGATSWADVGRIPDGVLYFYNVEPTACAGAALSAIKTVEPYPIYDPNRATPETYTITVRNDGREPVTSISVLDDIPPGEVAIAVFEIPPGATDNSSPTGGRFGAGYIKVDDFALPPGTEAHIRFRFKAAITTANNARVLRNQAQVTGLSGSGQLIETLTDDPSTHAVLDSTDILPVSSHLPLAITAFWNQDVDLDLRVVDPCGNAIGPADLPSAECPPGQPGGAVRSRGACGDLWPWGWAEAVNWLPSSPTGTGPPAPGRYEVWLRYTASRDSDPACRHGGLEDAVVLVEKDRAWDYRWVVLDPLVPDWIPALTFMIP